jgi:hypothetical protein
MPCRRDARSQGCLLSWSDVFPPDHGHLPSRCPSSVAVIPCRSDAVLQRCRITMLLCCRDALLQMMPCHSDALSQRCRVAEMPCRSDAFSIGPMCSLLAMATCPLGAPPASGSHPQMCSTPAPSGGLLALPLPVHWLHSQLVRCVPSWPGGPLALAPVRSQPPLALEATSLRVTVSALVG